jgi:hypothetical protein
MPPCMLSINVLGHEEIGGKNGRGVENKVKEEARPKISEQ